MVSVGWVPCGGPPVLPQVLSPERLEQFRGEGKKKKKKKKKKEKKKKKKKRKKQKEKSFSYSTASNTMLALN